MKIRDVLMVVGLSFVGGYGGAYLGATSAQPQRLSEAQLSEPVMVAVVPPVSPDVTPALLPAQDEDPRAKLITRVGPKELADSAEVRRLQAIAAPVHRMDENWLQIQHADLLKQREAETVKAVLNGAAEAEEYDLTDFQKKRDQAARDGKYRATLRFGIPKPAVEPYCWGASPSDPKETEEEVGHIPDGTRCYLKNDTFGLPAKDLSYYTGFASTLARRLKIPFRMSNNCGWMIQYDKENPFCRVTLEAYWGPVQQQAKSN